jgi:TetR/AcrR family transcriptional regulator, regulator of cefoperazone and chloramphenicol sensitivity
MRNSPSAPTADETRTRLLEAADAIFSELGFQGATTRMICERAHANPAAVNYHFGDKLGLYTEILKSSLGQDVLQIDAQQLLEMEPEAALGEFVSRFFHGLRNLDGKQRHMRVLGHELSQPTPALATVIEQIFRPLSRLLCEIISRITGCRPEALGSVLACQSIIAQVTQYMTARPILNLLWTKWPEGAGSNEEIVAHITRFSLAGLRALEDDVPKPRSRAAGVKKAPRR